MQFAEGKPRPANAGRRKGTPNCGTERARRLISEADDKEIVARVVIAAKAGDPHATQLYFRFLRPPPSRTAYTVPINLEPPKSAPEARDMIAEVTSMIAKAEIDGEHGSRVIVGLEAFMGARVAELEAKVKTLIGARKGNGADEEPIEIAPVELEGRIIDLKLEESGP